MKWFHFILSHSIFISICAAGLCLQTYVLLNIPVDYWIIAFIFFCTLAGYNLYWLISKYYFTAARNIQFFKLNFSNLSLFFISSVVAIVLLFYIDNIIQHLIVSVILAGLYSLPLIPLKYFRFVRNAGYMKTLLLAFSWTYATIMFPVETSFFNISIDVAILFAARFSFMLMLCLIFDSRDIAVDKIHGLKSLATEISRKHLQLMMWMAFIIYIAAGILLRISFGTYLQIIAFVITGILTFIVYRLSQKKQGYFFYYFITDGLMLFSALATYMASI